MPFCRWNVLLRKPLSLRDASTNNSFFNQNDMTKKSGQLNECHDLLRAYYHGHGHGDVGCLLCWLLVVSWLHSHDRTDLIPT